MELRDNRRVFRPDKAEGSRSENERLSQRTRGTSGSGTERLTAQLYYELSDSMFP